MTPQTKAMLLSTVRTFAALIAGGAATHGFIQSSQVEAWTGLIVGAVVWGYSLWDKYGRDTVGPIILAQLEVLKAKSLAQAAAMKAKGVPPVTVKQIADASAASPAVATMTPAAVNAAIATLPPEVAASVASVVVQPVKTGT